jgi:hypothetical protein
MIKEKAQTQETEEVQPVYTNWDFPTFMKNNPNATPEQVRQFLQEKRARDFFIKPW